MAVLTYFDDLERPSKSCTFSYDFSYNCAAVDFNCASRGPLEMQLLNVNF